MPLRRAVLPALMVTLLAPAGLAAQQPFQGSITYRMQSEEMSLSMTMMAKGPLLRTDMEMPDGAGSMYVLMHADSGITRAVIPEMGMYMEMDMKAMMESAMAMLPQRTRDSLAAVSANVAIEALGTGDEIAGVPCQNYRFRSGGEEMEGCVATGLGSLGGMGTMGAAGGGPLAGLVPDMSAYAKEFPDGMLPLRMRLLHDGKWETIMEATAIERKILDDALFVLPAGLRRMDPPGS